MEEEKAIRVAVAQSNVELLDTGPRRVENRLVL